jgi:hypothetical protein
MSIGSGLRSIRRDLHYRSRTEIANSVLTWVVVTSLALGANNATCKLVDCGFAEADPISRTDPIVVLMQPRDKLLLDQRVLRARSCQQETVKCPL